MIVEPRPGIESVRGTYRNSDLCCYPRGGKIIAASKVRPANPRTSDQVLNRLHLAQTTQQWGWITQAQRTAWDDYARKYYVKENPVARTYGLRGQDAFTRVNMTRLMLEMGFRDEAPVHSLPSRLIGLEAVGATRPGEMRFRLVPGSCSCDNVVVLKITPATATVARAPRRKDARCICGINPRSAAPVPYTGGLFSFQDVRFDIRPGRRFGAIAFYVRLGDGVPCDPCFADLICPEPEYAPEPPL